MSRKLMATLLILFMINIKLTSTSANHHKLNEVLMNLEYNEKILKLLQSARALCQAEDIKTDRELKEHSLNLKQIVEKEKKGIPLTTQEIVATYQTVLLSELARLTKNSLRIESSKDQYYKKNIKKKDTTINEFNEFCRG